MFFLTRSALCIGVVVAMALKPGAAALPSADGSLARSAASRILAVCASAPRCTTIATASASALLGGLPVASRKVKEALPRPERPAIAAARGRDPAAGRRCPAELPSDRACAG